MIPNPNPNPTPSPPAAPSRNALRVLRRLALAGSTVGSFCTVAAITYEVHRRVRVAERIVENKRALQTSAPNYDATSAARRLARMMEVAEAGDFMGIESLKQKDRELQMERSRAENNSPPGIESGKHEAPLSDLDLPGPDPAHSSLKSFIPADFRPPQQTFAGNDALAQTQRASPVPLNLSPPDPSSEDPTSLASQMQELLLRGRPIDAAQMFLDAHPSSLDGISIDRRARAVDAFYINCEQGNVYIARSLFERLEAVDKVSPRMWQWLLFALARKGALESVSTIHERYMSQFSLSPRLIDIVLRALVETRRLTAAKQFLFRHIQSDRECGLCGAYLTGLWKKTRSVELMNAELHHILVRLPRLNLKPTHKLFNPVLHAYVEFGRQADAEAMVEDMIVQYHIPLSCRTKGLLVYGKALLCDWEGVSIGLRQMYDLGMTQGPRQREFLVAFDRVFREYWVSHSGREIREFLLYYIVEFQLVPDKLLYKNILQALVDKGTRDMVSEFTAMARERAWNVRINEEEFLEMLRSQRLALERNPVGFWRMLQAARAKQAQTASSQHVLGYDQHSFPLPEVNVMPRTHESLPWYRRAVSPVRHTRPPDAYQKLHKQMAHFIHSGRLKQALVCYGIAKSRHFNLSSVHVQLAVIATLLEEGLEAARTVSRTEWLPFQKKIRVAPQFLQQVQEIDGSSEGEVIKLAVFRFYDICWQADTLTLKHHLTTRVSRRLILEGKPEVAVDLLTAVYRSVYSRRQEFDAVCMKMLLRAFAAMDDLAGVRWCALTALSRRSALNADLVAEMERIQFQQQQRQQQRRPGQSDDGAKTAAPVRVLAILTDALRQKSGRVPAYRPLRADAATKRFYRRRYEKRAAAPERQWKEDFDLVETVKRWDEQYELEAVLGTLETDKQAIMERWSERRCVGELMEEGEGVHVCV